MSKTWVVEAERLSAAARSARGGEAGDAIGGGGAEAGGRGLGHELWRAAQQVGVQASRTAGEAGARTVPTSRVGERTTTAVEPRTATFFHSCARAVSRSSRNGALVPSINSRLEL